MPQENQPQGLQQLIEARQVHMDTQIAKRQETLLNEGIKLQQVIEDAKDKNMTTTVLKNVGKNIAQGVQEVAEALEHESLSGGFMPPLNP